MLLSKVLFQVVKQKDEMHKMYVATNVTVVGCGMTIETANEIAMK